MVFLSSSKSGRLEVMKIRLFFFGKQTEITAREQELIKRISFRSQIEVIAIPQAGIKEDKKCKEKEADKLLEKITEQDFVIALDEKGTEIDSLSFSKKLKDYLVEQGTVNLVIGGAYGLDKKILNRANLNLSLGKMTWTRDLARLMIIEQLYRALEIDGGGRFHK